MQYPRTNIPCGYDCVDESLQACEELDVVLDVQYRNEAGERNLTPLMGIRRMHLRRVREVLSGLDLREWEGCSCLGELCLGPGVLCAAALHTSGKQAGGEATSAAAGSAARSRTRKGTPLLL